MNRRPWMACAVFVSLASLCAVGAQSPGDDSVGWVALYSDAQLSWLENENLMKQLCAGHASQTPAWYACEQALLAARTHVVRLRTAPDSRAPLAGDLIIVALPGKGLQAFYARQQGGPAVAVTPDLYDSDWGYGPYFHATVVERRGTWVRLPEDPFPAGAWLDTVALATADPLRWVNPGDIVTSPRGNLYVTAVSRGEVRARLEQPADMWCDASPAPPLVPSAEVRLAGADLYTATGHLRLHIKYTRGC
jgi:hypothetical protein